MKNSKMILITLFLFLISLSSFACFENPRKKLPDESSRTTKLTVYENVDNQVNAYFVFDYISEYSSQLHRITYYEVDTSPALPAKIGTFHYDTAQGALDRIEVEMFSGEKHSIGCEYDTQGRLNILREIDAEGATVRYSAYEYDAGGVMIEMHHYGPDDVELENVFYSYDRYREVIRKDIINASDDELIEYIIYEYDDNHLNRASDVFNGVHTKTSYTLYEYEKVLDFGPAPNVPIEELLSFF